MRRSNDRVPAGRPLRAAAAAIAGLLALAAHTGPAAQTAGDGPSLPLSVRLTSPLGRTGLTGVVRIVAQVAHPKDVPLKPVRFLVDGVLLGTDANGPPYSVEWVDDNPLVPREIAAEVTDALGRTARDSVYLEPFIVEERTEVTSVLVEATVHDRQGRFVVGLPAASFSLTENGEPQALDVVRPETLPSTYALLVDSSQSMSRRVDFLREAAYRLTGFLRPGDRMVVAPFTRALGAITGPTDDRHTIADAVGAITAGGGTAILDALVDATRLLAGIEGRHAIVLLTDGYDEHSTRPLDEALAALQGAKATVYVIGVGGVAGISLKGERFLRQIAAETGGRAFFPWREHDLPGVHQMLSADVSHRYLITYTPVNQAADGTWRAIALMTSEPAYTVRARTGYFAPRPPPVRAAMEFTVTGAGHQFLDVTRDDITVFEDGVEQTVDSFQEAVSPVSIVLALDTSGSMRAAAAAVQDAARSFVGALRPEDRLATILFSDRPRFVHDLSLNRRFSLDAIDEYVARGGTALYDATYDALSRLEREAGRRAVVVLTDGRDENNPGTAPGSLRTFDEVLARVRETEAIVFTIGLGPQVDRDVLARLAAESGGDAYFPEDVSTLAADYARIIEHLRRRFVIGYTSTNSTRDGAWRRVEIVCRHPESTVRSQGGYRGPAK